MGKKLPLSQKLSKFEGVFCSGFFIPDQAMVTALALLFDKVHFLNQLEYVIELSKTYTMELSELNDFVEKIKLIPKNGQEKKDPLSPLSAQQRRTVLTYLFLGDRFFVRNALLFPEIFKCSLLPKSEVFSAKLIEKGKKGQLNKYEVTRNPLVVCKGAQDELNEFISQGKIPIVGGIASESSGVRSKRFSASEIAAALAIKSVVMVLPGTQAATAEEILETRERLKDHLPPFWSAMLKLSSELSERLDPKSDEKILQSEVDNAVSTTVRPALIDLVHKMEKERKQWFRRVLSPLAKGMRVLVGKPPSDLASLVSASLTVGADITLDVAQQLRKVEALKRDSGLTYVIELYKALV